MAKQPKETWSNGREYKGIVQCKKIFKSAIERSVAVSVTDLFMIVGKNA